LTCLNDVITPESDDTLKNEHGSIYTVIKTHHPMQGQKYGHLACTIPKTNYRIIMSNNTWMHMAPADPGAYSQAALAIGNATALHKQPMAQQKVLVQNHANNLKVEEAGKELILYTVGDDALTLLKKQCIGFGNKTMLRMIHHLYSG
jgi:hypothetical protein